LSNSFAGSSTRTLEGLTREVEKRLDVFTDDFSPPGSREQVPGADFSKTSNNYQDRHTDESPHPDLPIHVKSDTLSVGDPNIQKYLDNLDKEVQQYEAQIKTPKEQFPGVGALLDKLEGYLKDPLWKEAKKASLAAYGKVNLRFAMWAMKRMKR